MKKIFFAIGVGIVLISSLFVVDIAFAKKTLGDHSNALSQVSGKSGITEGSVSTIVGNLAAGALALAGIIFFILAVYSGLVWMTARGNDERVTKARNTLIASVIGLVILVSAYAITSFIQNRVINQIPDSTYGNPAPDMAGSGASGQVVGCCLDWINEGFGEFGGEIYGETVAARWTTQTDCKYWGENDGSGDSHSCPGPKVGCWLWSVESSSMPNYDACNASKDKY